MRKTCGDCIYCKTGKRFINELRRWDGGTVTDDTPRKDLYISENKKMTGYITLCVRDLHDIHQVSDHDDMCRYGEEETNE